MLSDYPKPISITLLKMVSAWSLSPSHQTVQFQQLQGDQSVLVWYGGSTHGAERSLPVSRFSWHYYNMCDAGTVGNQEWCFGPCASIGRTENILVEAWLSWCTVCKICRCYVVQEPSYRWLLLYLRFSSVLSEVLTIITVHLYIVSFVSIAISCWECSVTVMTLYLYIFLFERKVWLAVCCVQFSVSIHSSHICCCFRQRRMVVTSAGIFTSG